MGMNAPSEKLPVAKKSPAEIASDKQKGLLSDVEKESTIAEKKYRPGEKALTQEQRAKMTPEQRKKYPLLEKGKKYISVGAVDKVPFKPVLRDKGWYVEMAATGKNLIQNFDAVSFDFPGLDKASLRKAVENIASVSTLDLITGTVTTEDYKKKIESGFSADEIYGVNGAFNVILAFGRAQDLLNNVQPGASIDYRLKLAVNRYSKLLAKKVKAEKVEGKSDTFRQNIVEKAKSANKEPNEMFNEVMNDYFKQSRKLVERIALCARNGRMTPEEAHAYGESLNNLRYKDAESRADVSDEDMDRLVLVSETVERVQAAVEKAEKPEKPAAPAVRKESYDEREARANAMSIINEGNLEKHYAWKEESEQDVEAMIKSIAHDVVAAVNPSDAPAAVEIPLYEEALYALIRASLRNELKERKTARENNHAISPEYTLSENEKVRYVSSVLSRMSGKTPRVKRNNPHS